MRASLGACSGKDSSLALRCCASRGGGGWAAPCHSRGLPYVRACVQACVRECVFGEDLALFGQGL
eukprot:4010198-Alexandrium_andersonii.AAC.1